MYLLSPLLSERASVITFQISFQRRRQSKKYPGDRLLAPTFRSSGGRIIETMNIEELLDYLLYRCNEKYG